MRPKMSVVTLGVRDLVRAREFYEALGWSPLPRPAGSDVMAMAHSEPSEGDVDRVYVTDLDGHLWELAHNPFED